MDKKKALRKLEELGATKYWELGDVIQILKSVVKEMSDDRGLDLGGELSLTEALEAARDGKRVRHESWIETSYLSMVGKSFVRVLPNGDIDDRFKITTNILTGWIVLDK